MTKTNAERQAQSRERRAIAYDIIKLMAARDGIELPNARNQGAEFDEWLRIKAINLRDRRNDEQPDIW